MDESVSQKLFVKKVNINYKILSLTNECHDCWQKKHVEYHKKLCLQVRMTFAWHFLGSANTFQAMFQKK